MTHTFQGTDRFQIIRPIGKGGMGVVFEAWDTERDLRVALKLLPTLEPLALYRFKQEFRSLTELSHPNLCQLYELISEGDQWFFTMELLENAGDFFPEHRSRIASSEAAAVEPATLVGGATVVMPATQLSGRALAPAEQTPSLPPPDYGRVRSVFGLIAAGMQALHEAGKLHRDLKPANVIVCKDGEVKLLDFGLVASLGAATQPGHALPSEAAANFATAQTLNTTAGIITGTLAYMSPEQSLGEPLTTASDWYSFGVILHEVLTGSVPFHQTGEDFLRHKQTVSAPAPSLAQPATPADLDALCNTLLSTDPSQRPAGEAVLATLAPGMAHTPALDSAFVGRKTDLARLREAWHRARDGACVALRVHGRSGTGKSSLLRHYLQSLEGPTGPIVLSGRCYEQESVPYKALDSVVDALTHHLLMLPESQVAALLPAQVSALARIFPVLNRVPAIAAAAKPESVDLREVQGLAFAALRELLTQLGEQHGLVILIDDLQWGDVDSAALLRDLLRPPRAPAMLLLLAFRTEHIGSSACVDALTQDGKDELVIAPLSLEDSESLALSLLGPERRSQAGWIVRESQGVPFFIHELARHIHEHGEGGNISRDLDEVLWRRIEALPTEEIALTRCTAVAGEPQPLRVIHRAASLPAPSPRVVNKLRVARVLRTAGPSLDDEIECFHDRVRESVRSRMDPQSRRDLHGSLADTLEANHARAEQLAPHYEAAGRTREAGLAYARAAQEAETALAFNRAEEFYTKAISLISDPLQRSQVQERMIHFLTNTARFADAYQLTRESVRGFGIALPAGFVPLLFIADFLRSKWLMRGLKPAAILDRPTMSNPQLLAAVRLINAGAKAAYQVRPELCVAISTRAVNLCLQHGITPDCAIGWMVYGAIFQGGILGQHALGHEFGKLALGLVEKFQNQDQRAEVHFVVGYFGTSWMQPASEAEKLWRISWRAGQDTGDLFHTGCASAGLVISQFMRGMPLDSVLGEIERLRPLLERCRLREPLGVLDSVRQAVRCLRGLPRQPGSFATDDFDDEAFRSTLADYGSRHFAHIYFILRMQCLYLVGQHAEAADYAKLSAAYLKDSPGMLHSAEHHFYAGMNAAAVASKASGLARWKLLRQVRSAHKRFTTWASHTPENFLARERLLAAELARLDGKKEQANACCVAALQAATQHTAPHLQGLAAKLAGRADEAAICFERWGARL